jgi:phosphatidate cytidylyltransferase
LLRNRLISSAILIAGTLLLLWLDLKHPLGSVVAIWLVPLLLFFAMGTALDLATMLRASGRSISRRWVLATSAMVTLSPCVPMLWPIFGSVYPPDCPVGMLGWIVVAVVSAIFLFLIREILVYQPGREGVLARTLAGVFASVYVGVPMALLVVIRSLGTTHFAVNGAVSVTWGLAALVTTIATTKSSDAGAYFTGKAFGRHKLIPQLSPGKTWEGAVGGIAVAVLVSYGCFVWLIPALANVTNPAPWWAPLIFGTVCAITGLVGDLAESMVKRESGVKDSGKTLPGLGGVWDVTDSLIGAVMPAWIMLASGIAGS